MAWVETHCGRTIIVVGKPRKLDVVIRAEVMVTVEMDRCGQSKQSGGKIRRIRQQTGQGPSR